MLPDPDDRPVRPAARGSSLPLRGITIGFAAVALTVFGGLIGYTYLSHTGGSGGPAPLIKADPRPMKTAPEKPGGMVVPNQDKEIYARIDRNAPPQSPAPRVERLLPPPESPLPRPRPAEAPPPLEPEIPAAPTLEPPANAVEVPQTPPAQPPRAAAPSPPVPPPPTAKPAVPPPPPPPQQAQAPRAAAPAPPASAPSSAASGRYRIQLAALRTSEDATREWEKLRRAHSELGPLSLNVVRADLGDRGIFFRIQAGPLADEQAAKELCQKLTAKKVGCLVVRP